MSNELRHALRAPLERELIELDAAQSIVSDALASAQASDKASEQHGFELLERVYSISDATPYILSELH